MDIKEYTEPQLYFLKDNGIFPNSPLPVLYYRNVLDLPFLLPAEAIKNLFAKNNWTNSWRSGIFTYHHYHSITHEVLGICKGRTQIILGGDDGITLDIEEGDVLIIPAGVAHKNAGQPDDVVCVGGYPDGKDYDMNYGNDGERPLTDGNIRGVALPETDPVYGKKNGLPKIWKQQYVT